MGKYFWNSYLNLEEEYLSLAKFIHVDDNQLGVYSTKIADLLTSAVMQIEAVSKALYLANGGPKPNDNNLFFDTDCIDFLIKIWSIDVKKVFVGSTALYLIKPGEIELQPLINANKRSKADWNKAYQAVKHDRQNSLKKGNLRNLLHALAALYLLNVYFLSATFPCSNESGSGFDNRLQSRLFYVKVHPNHGINPNGKYNADPDFDECVYLIKPKDEEWKEAIKALKSVNDEIQKIRIEELNKHIVDIVASKDRQAAVNKIIQDNFAQHTKDAVALHQNEMRNAFGNLKYEAVINKGAVPTAI